MTLYPETTALHLPFKQKIIQVIKIWAVMFVFIFGAGIIIMATNFLINNFYHISLAETNQIKNTINEKSTKYLWIPLIAPLIEETLFRLWQDYKIKHILIAAFTLVSVLLIRAIHLQNQIPKYIYEGLLDILIIVCLFKQGIGKRVLKVPLEIRKIIFYIVAILFGLIHITNFAPLYPRFWFVYPILILPQIIMGFAFGYGRIKYGFFFGVLLHVMINGLFVLLHT